MGNPGNSVGRAFRLVSAILIMTCGVVLDVSQAASWSAINSGLPSAAVNVSAIVIAPASPSTLYANTRGPDGVGGIFKTTDGAGSWRAISSIVGVNSLIVDPRNPSTVYVFTGRGLLKSTNGGESWTAAGSGLPNTYISALVIDPISSSTLYAVSGGPTGGIFKSTNGGESWHALDTGLAPNSSIGSLVIDPLTPSRIYAIGFVPQPAPGGPPAAVILKSTDGGASWNAIDAGLPPFSTIRSLVIAPSSPSTIYANVYLGHPNGPPDTGILKSVDGGASWDTLNTGLPSNVSVDSLVIDPKNSSTIYIVAVFPFAEAGGILKSIDGGASWTAMNPGLPANTPIHSLAIDSVTSSTMYMIADGSIFKSTDGGTKWNRAATGLSAINVGVLATNRFDAATVYAGAGDSVFKSQDSGANWTKLFAFQLFLPPPSPLIIFPPFPDGAPAYPRSLLIDSLNPDILYATTSRGNGCYYADNLLFKSTDGGTSWSGSISPDKSGCVMGGLGPAGLEAIDPTDPNTLYVAEADDEDGGWWLLRSNDGGASWNSTGNFPAKVQAGVWALVIDPTNPATLYAGVDDVPQYSDSGDVQPGMGGVFKSTDGGVTWNSIGLSGSAVKLLAIDPTHPNVLYAATEGNYSAPRGFRGLFKSTDSGESWSPINNGLASLSDIGFNMTAIVIDPANSNTLYVGTSGGGVFKSADAGANWSQFNSGLTNFVVHGLAIAPGSGHTLYVGTSGGVFKIVDAAQ